MAQIYHSNARTNIHIRSAIKNSTASISEMSVRYKTSENTIAKWSNRELMTDKSSKPHHIEYALSEELQLIAISIRKSTWLALDQIHDMLLVEHKTVSRSSLYRLFKKEKINTLPEEKKEKAKLFKEYEPGYLHIDVTYLPKIEGKTAYLFVAIDRATRAVYYKIYTEKTAVNAADFMDSCIAYFPFSITHVLTDNGLEFTNRLIMSKKGKLCEKPSQLDEKCTKNNIEHRLTKPATPKTNGMVERVNGTIKNNTILVNQYQNPEEMALDLLKFMFHYNLQRAHSSLKKELKVKTPMQAIEKWYQLKPEIFNKTPQEFKNNLLILYPNLSPK